MKRRGRRRRAVGELVEIQMGPMIDMVFLLLVFFMVTARPTKPESDIKMRLPGQAAQDVAVELPDEQRLRISSDGEISLNDMRLDSKESRDLPELVKVLTRFRRAAALSRSEALVTIDPADDVAHQRVVDVLGACARSGLNGITFASLASSEEVR